MSAFFFGALIGAAAMLLILSILITGAEAEEERLQAQWEQQNHTCWRYGQEVATVKRREYASN